MQHKCKVTVIDKKCFNDLQEKYLADPKSGACPCYNVGDEFLFERYDIKDDFWHVGLNTLTETKCSSPESVAGGAVKPQCSEAWDCISRYIYTALQGGSIMRNWTNDERMMIACCSDGTRPVIFKIQRIDYAVLYIANIKNDDDKARITKSLKAISAVSDVIFKERFTEVILENKPSGIYVPDEMLKNAVELAGDFKVLRID